MATASEYDEAMRSVRTDDGQSIAYEVRGDGPLTLLFMHGWSGSGDYFRETLEHLDISGLRAVTFDLRGHGDSSKPESGYTDERLARDALAVADAVGAESLVIVGFSMSGRFAQYLAVVAPERIRGQVLVAGCPAGPIPLPEEVHQDWVARAGDAQRLAEVTASFAASPVNASVLTRFGQRAALASRMALDETLRVCRSVSVLDKVQSADVPTLVVGGIYDAIFSPDVLRGWTATFRRGRLVLLDAGHEIPIERPREFAAVLGAFVAGLSA
jgi:pimeloyl-ACP methyl ester carboxylesterase